MLIYRNIKTLLQKVTLPIGLKKFLWSKKLKTVRSSKKNCERKTKKKLKKKKWLREDVKNYMSNGKIMINDFNSWLPRGYFYIK